VSGRRRDVRAITPAAHGASWITVELAIGRAWADAAWHTSSAMHRERAGALPQWAAAVGVSRTARHTPQGGGLPVCTDGRAVGGMGASASTGQHDAEVVKRAIDRVAGQQP
jgi:uncharacterized protein GlcG (DUF336 family)